MSNDFSSATSWERAHPLLAPLPPDQRSLIDIVASVWLANRARWPTRRYVEHEMDRLGLDLAQVLASFPVLGAGAPGSPSYSAFWYDRGSFAPDRPIGLTIAGVGHLPPGNQVGAEVFLRLLRDMAGFFLEGSLDPFGTDPPEVSLAALSASFTSGTRAWLTQMPEIFSHEPATWGGEAGDEADPKWRYTRAMRHFVGVADIPDYVARLNAYLTPPSKAASPVYAEPLDLPSCLDFLDTVWRLTFGRALLRLPSTQVVLSLAADAASAEEFDARLGSLVQVLKGFQVEATPGLNHPVPRMEAQLLRLLPNPAHLRIESAMAVLRAVSDVRNASQHVMASPATVDALRLFGLDYPLTEWRHGWDAIRNGTAHALAQIRDELLDFVRLRPSGMDE